MDPTKYQFTPKEFTVLVIDDTPANLMVLVDFLSEVGFRVLTARNGLSGLQRAIHGQPDIILLDVLMPDINGFETCQRLKAQPETEHIPVIFMTALNDATYKVSGFEAGGIDYVVKPFEQAEVLARLKTHLINNRLTRALDQMVVKRTEALHASLERERILRQQLDAALAKEKELNALKSRIIEAVNHEFRTPLTIINQVAWFLNRTQDELDASKLAAYVERVERASGTIDQLLKSLETTKNLTDRLADVYLESLDWRDFCAQLEHVLDEFKGESQHIEPTLVSFEFSAPVQTDIDIVKTIFRELLKNAIRFSESDSSIMVGAHLVDDQVTISVKDEGIGVPAEERDKIFEAFYRASNVEARRGLGIGLHIAAQMADLIGGEIELQDRPSGSEFILKLPNFVPLEVTSEYHFNVQEHSPAIVS